MQEIPKAYEPQGIEDAIYQMWLDSGYFNPDNLPNLSPEAENFSIVLPPPNVTGTLHMGHASMLAIEDAMVRFARLSGKRTVWIPGTDHAAIATQSKVEGLIFKAEGKNRHDLGREPFLARVREFAQNSHDTIVNQSKKMGSSLDWSREAYTLDDARNRAVVTAFKRMYEDGLIYRGHRVINWDPIGQTTIADDEIVYKETTATLYTFKYDKNFPIAISTTRPETKVGDAAVAVHPEDARYKEFVGKTFEVNFCGVELSIKVVADESVDPAFGTGALGVTPAHSTIDFEIAGRHGLALRQVIGEDARMTPEAGPVLAGLTTLEAREATVAWLRANDLIISEEIAPQNISTAERTGGIVEPLPKLQWFIGVNTEFVHLSGKTTTLKKLMQEAVKSEAIEIIPERFNKTYFHWIDNLRDWCISRQIWFGHRVPAWYRGDGIAVGEMPAGEGWTQDPDTLDTWFSSGLWTFSTLGWPDETADLKRFHPTSVLETGYDILFFWVARMILMSTYLVDQVPFKTVYLHGLVRDAEGRKMSKSLGNIIDPLDMIAKYGADATRLSLMIGGAPGNDLKLSEEKIAGYRNFTNKLWNISRFVITKVGEARHVESVEPKTLSDRFILGRFAEVTERATGFMASHDFSLAGEALRDFAWNEFADWYLEIAKIEGDKDDILLFILERLLTMWHPFMPFVTEEIYKQFNRGLLMVGTWPKDVNFALSSADLKAFEELQNAVVAIRNLRAQYKVEPKMIVKVVVPTGSSILDQATIIGALSRAEISSVDEMPSVGIATAVVGSERVGVLLEGLVDVAKERVRIEKELETTKKYVIAQTSKLGNQDFVARAPEAVIAGEKEKLRLAEEKLKTLEAEMTALS